jgi:V-type H+-transporting ATPase subunit F
MAGRGKLIAVIGDEDTVTGFLLGGIGELNKNRHPNFLVVEKDTTINEIEDTFRYGSLLGLNGSFRLLQARGELVA